MGSDQVEQRWHGRWGGKEDQSPKEAEDKSDSNTVEGELLSMYEEQIWGDQLSSELCFQPWFKAAGIRLQVEMVTLSPSHLALPPEDRSLSWKK